MTNDSADDGPLDTDILFSVEGYVPTGQGLQKLGPLYNLQQNWPVFLALAVLIYWMWSE